MAFNCGSSTFFMSSLRSLLHLLRMVAWVAVRFRSCLCVGCKKAQSAAAFLLLLLAADRPPLRFSGQALIACRGRRPTSTRFRDTSKGGQVPERA